MGSFVVDMSNSEYVKDMQSKDGVRLRHQFVTFEDKTDTDCTIVGKDIFSRKEIKVRKVPWVGLVNYLIFNDYIQNAFRDLSANDREFILNGVGEDLFGEETD